MNRLVIRLLSRHISPLQLFGFFVANLIGMAIILLGCQFYQDATSVLGAKDRFMKGDYIIISKQVRGGLFSGKKNNSFSASEIEELSKQDFALRVGRFLPSKFR
ncbi:MAG: ABC transporter permease, partial [Porphyromonadaceae bacterium]|nr:ABC transporter permease [Porphyromonadaceae bacterium]